MFKAVPYGMGVINESFKEIKNFRKIIWGCLLHVYIRLVKMTRKYLLKIMLPTRN